jgi:PIN domain nuclease of toxin-antitoxin system
VSDVYALDTNALVFYGLNDLHRLGKRARAIIDRFEAGTASLVVPSVALIELWFLFQAGRFPVEITLATWWQEVLKSGLLSIDLTAEDVMAATSLAWGHRDPYDRLIVASTLRYGCPLITSDAAIAAWGGIEVIW